MNGPRPNEESRAWTAPLVPLAAMLGAIVSLSVGSSFAKTLFPLVGPAGATTYRVIGAALLLGAFARPWRYPLTRQNAAAIALYGSTLGLMNLLFYEAIRTLPMGVATAIEFSGPLAVAVVSSRRLLDLAWIALALVGLATLLPLRGAGGLDRMGVLYALGAATCWAFYIVFGKRIGGLPGGQSVGLGLAVAALTVAPVGLVSAGPRLLDPRSILLGLGVAAMSSAIPYSLEMVALRRLPKQAFGVMLSMDPAVAAVAALVVLGERLTPAQWAAVLLIMAASVGTALTARPETGPKG